MADHRSRSGSRQATSPKRDEILTVAAELFAERGFEATTIQDIADRVGMLKGSLYYHIKSKEQLLVEIVQDTHEIFSRNLDAVDRLDGGPVEKIWAFVYRNVLANATHHVQSTVFFNEFRSIADVDRQKILAMRDAHDHMLRALIESGQRRGEVCPSLEVKLTAIGVLTMCNALYRWYRPGGQWGPDDIARGYADFVVAALACAADGPCRHRTIDSDGVIAQLSALVPGDVPEADDIAPTG